MFLRQGSNQMETPENKTKLYLAVVILLLALSAGGYVLLKNYIKQPTPTKLAPQPTSMPSPTPSSAVSSLEREVLILPDKNASEQKKQTYYNLVASQAKSADTLDVTNCQASPLVLKTKLEQSINLINQGKVERKLNINGVPVVVPAGGKTALSIKTVAKNGRGTYAYLCDLSTSASGILLVE